MDSFAVSGPNGFDVSLENLVEVTVGRSTGDSPTNSTVVPFPRRRRWQRVIRRLSSRR